MGCERCDQFDTTVAIHSPGQLRRICETVRAAVSGAVLHYNSFESSRELIGQENFMALDFQGPLADVMRYHFECTACGNCYGLFVETYHGSGGKWTTLGNASSNSQLDTDAIRRQST
jgi:hypothetical protein